MTIQNTIPSYLYQEYADDETLQAFVSAYNTLTQQYVNWFNQIDLPVYTNPLITGPLLDWVARGLYGFVRPVLPYGSQQVVGPLNTYAFNALPELNALLKVGNTNFFATTDDIFKRVITWHFFKGDGNRFDIRWFKRRIMRFLIGVNGTNPNIDQTYQVSIKFFSAYQVTIDIETGGAVTPTLAMILQSGIVSGALETPFQFQYNITINELNPTGWVFGSSAFGTGGF